MSLVSLRIRNFRCFTEGEIALDPRSTIISGVNGGGKTSVLEAVHVLSTGRSFRTVHNELLIKRPEAASFVVTGEIRQQETVVTAGLEWSAKFKDLRFDGRSLRTFSEIARAVPVQIIDPSTHKLIDEGPIQRRRFIDWGVFHVEPQFHAVWRKFSLALAQRNAALKSQSDASVVHSWDAQIVEFGQLIFEMRRSYLDGLRTVVTDFSERVLGASVNFELKRGWDAQSSLEESLAKCWLSDVRLRTTTVGPHRADLQITIANVAAKEVVSRGQQKLLASILILAQLQQRVMLGGKPAILLLDDPAAELDVNNLGKLLRLIEEVPAQLVVTALDPATVKMIARGNKFHVEQGCLRPVV